jgi:hypothetical protein
MPSYLVIAATFEDPEARFEYESVEPLATDSVFADDSSDAVYKAWRVLADDSGRYDGLVNADQLVGV